MKEYLVCVKYRFKLEEDDLSNKAAMLDYLGNQKYDDGLGEYFGPGHDLKYEERNVEFEEGTTQEQGFIVGKCFHTFEEVEGVRKLCWQGQVLAMKGDFILVQTYEWIGGGLSCQKVVPLNDTIDWDFYDTHEEMNETFKRKYAKRGY